MRYARVVFTPTEPTHPAERRLEQAEDVSRERIYNVTLLDDGTAVLLKELSGNQDRAREILADSAVINYQITEADDVFTAYMHYEPAEHLVELLSLLRELELVLETPLEYTNGGGFRACVVGRGELLRGACELIPEEFDADLERLGDFEPETRRVYGELTPRQRETLAAALDAGYYETPRTATQQDVAEELDRSSGTVGEHLRKVEATVLSAISPQ